MSKSRFWVFAAVFCLLLTVACGGGNEGTHDEGTVDEGAAATTDPNSVGAVSGTISYSGSEDPDQVIDMGADPNCQDMHSEPVETQRVVVGASGGLANAFVYVKDVEGSYPAPSEAVTMVQEGCQYKPHVFGIQTGQKLVIKNADATLHNVHATPGENTEFNEAQPFPDMELEKTFDEVEVMVPFKCDVHPWMSAYAGVLDHPFFAVTGEDGSFEIEGIPAGTHTLVVWHEEFGEHEAEVTVEAGGSASLNHDYAGGDGMDEGMDGETEGEMGDEEAAE